MLAIQQLSAADGRRHLGALAEILLDCVAGGASVSFMASLSRAEAKAFFEKALDEVNSGSRILLAAFLDDQLVGTVQILTAMPPNQLHRANLAKLLVLRSARQQGIGRRLIEQAEEVSRLLGKTLLVLDTATGESGEALYLRLGWTRVGVIPKYALFPDGTWCDTTIFYKSLA